MKEVTALNEPREGAEVFAAIDMETPAVYSLCMEANRSASVFTLTIHYLTKQ